MIREAIDRILSLAGIQTVVIENRPYSEKALVPVTDPSPLPLSFRTLTGLVDYIKANIDKLPLLEEYAIIVRDYATVELEGPVYGQFKQRDKVARAIWENKAFDYGSFMDTETFIIGLQANFIAGDDLQKVLAVVGNVTEGAVKTNIDDGITQTITGRAGIQREAQLTVPNPVFLTPRRTFDEADQPGSNFVFRMKSPGPQAALFEADNGYWKHLAMLEIKEYLVEQLPDMTILA